jgi:hypothetical protein
LDIYFIYRYSTEVDEEKNSMEIAYGFSARCGLAVWMHWSCIDVIVLGLKSVEELYPSPPLGVDSADTSQLSKEKNLHG